MPRKYTRRTTWPTAGVFKCSNPACGVSCLEDPRGPCPKCAVDGTGWSTYPEGKGAPAVAKEPPALDQVPAARVLTAMEEYGLWLKQNQHVTQALPPEPSQPRKAPNVPRPRY